MVREITAKVLLSPVKQPDTWFGLKYSMNLYRGCQHGCIYCDTRSECYGIDDLSDVAIKANALDLLDRELARKRVRGTIGTGSMNDPYMPLEATHYQTGRALESIARHRFPVHILTKSDLVLRDLATIREIQRIYAAVSFTITTTDDDLAQKVEPGAPAPSRRLAAMAKLAQEGILTGVMLMSVLPFLEDSEENVSAIVQSAHQARASYIVASFGMTLRDRQREHYYQQLDHSFPGLRRQYERRFGQHYICPADNVRQLEALFQEECAHCGIALRMPMFSQQTSMQSRLF
jgi:DNA repair photolyase